MRAITVFAGIVGVQYGVAGCGDGGHKISPEPPLR